MGFKPAWSRQMDIFGLLDKVVELGLEGVHLDMAAIGSIEKKHLNDIKHALEDKELYIEFNWGMPNIGGDKRLQFDLNDGIEIAHQLGADIGKISLNLDRKRPVMASKDSPEILDQLEKLSILIKEIVPKLEYYNIKLALENHTDCYASELLWLLNAVDHPLVGACIDTVNPLMVGENPMEAIQALTQRSFTNHFRDSIIQQTRYGCKVVGCALGEGDLDLVKAYELITNSPGMNRINIEIAEDAPIDDKEKALEQEEQAIIRSIDFCRKHLKIIK